MRAAALTEAWVLPERADFLFVPAERFSSLYDGSVDTEKVRAVVFHDGDGVVRTVPADSLELFLGGLAKECQRIVCGLPFGKDLASVARRFTRRAVTIPPRPTDGKDATRPTAQAKHELNVVVVDGDRQEAALALAAELLGKEKVRHLAIFTHSADQAADLGDFLGVHGFISGRPGDKSAAIWLCPGEDGTAQEALEAMEEDAKSVATVSFSVPPDSETARQRHKHDSPAWALVAVRELRHLKELAAPAQLRLRRVRPKRPLRVSASIDALADRVGEVVGLPEATPYYLLVESLLDRFTAAEIAAATLLLLDKEREGKRQASKAGSHKSAAPITWVKLFVSAGSRDHIGTREILGTIASSSGVPGKRIGRIDVRESHSLVEVHESDAGKVIEAVNGITLGGRAVRVDYDRPRDRAGRSGGRGLQKSPVRGPRQPPARKGRASGAHQGQRKGPSRRSTDRTSRNRGPAGRGR